MGLEDITKPISTETLEEHEKQLSEKLLIFEFDYIDRILKGKIKPLNDTIKTDDIPGLILEYTELTKHLTKEYGKRVAVFNRQNFLGFQGQVLEEIIALYQENKDTWLDKIVQAINEEIETLGPILYEEPID